MSANVWRAAREEQIISEVLDPSDSRLRLQPSSSSSAIGKQGSDSAAEAARW